MPGEAPVSALNTPVKLRTASKELSYWKKVFHPLSFKVPALTVRESQILSLNSDYSTKSKKPKNPQASSAHQLHSPLEPQGQKVCFQGKMKWECCNTHRTEPPNGNAPQPGLATLSPSPRSSPASLTKAHLDNPLPMVTDTLTFMSS